MLSNTGFTYRVLIVDDDEIYRRLVRAMMEREDGFQLIAETGDESEAIELIERVDPDLILMDVQLQRIDGFEATRLILERYPDAKVILISRTRRGLEYTRRALEVGALGFIAKQNLTIDNLRQALQI